MNEALAKRLNQIEPAITTPAFLQGKGIGNEIACYIFDYAAKDEPQMRDHLAAMLKHIAATRPNLKVLHLDLLDVIMAYLDSRNLRDKTLKLADDKGDARLLKALRGPLAADKIRDFIARAHSPAEADLFLISGVGKAYPMLRAHSLLNCLHTVIGTTPLVMFYPGAFDGVTLRLFDRIASHTGKPGGKSYYRAFRLIPRSQP